MVSTTCLAHDDPNRIYHYCPSIAASIIFAILFGATTLFHTYQAVKYNKTFCWVLIMAATWETAGYAIRTLSITRQSVLGFYTPQFLLILLAPLWVNAFIYMVLGRMMHFFLRNDRIFGVRARRTTLMFVLFDIAAFLVQLAGGMLSSGDDQPVHLIDLGLKIYTGGVGLQLAFIAVFCGLAVQFRRVLRRQDVAQSREMAMEVFGADQEHREPYTNTDQVPGSPDLSYKDRTWAQARPLMTTLWFALAMIILRNIYRLVEYGMGGADGNIITRNEWWMYIFDAVPMLAGVVALSVCHPGRVLQGKRSDFKEEDKARKAEKKARKAERKAEKQAKKAERKVEKQAKEAERRREKHAKKDAKKASKREGHGGDSAERLV